MILLDEAPESLSKVRANRPASTQHSRQLQFNQQAARRTVENLAQRDVPGDGALTALYTNLHKSASNDPTIATPCLATTPHKKASAFARRGQIATAGWVILTTGVLAGAVWNASEISTPSQSAAIETSDAQSTTTHPASHEILIEPASPPAHTQAYTKTPTRESAEAIPGPAAANPATGKQAASPTADVLINELTKTRRLAEEYLEEIDWLHTQNYSLNQTIDDLDSETTALNYELLQLELKVISLEAAAKPQVEKRTVYNFVNVPIGGTSE